MLIASAFAQDAAAGQEPSALASFLPLILIMAIFYLLILRPQQKRYKQHQAMIKAVKKGDKVLTGGGVIGKVVKVDDKEEIVHVSVADSVTVQVARSTLSNVYDKDATKSSAEKPSKKDKAAIANDN